MNRLLRAKDVAEILGCGINRAYELMNSKSFPTIIIGRNKYVYEDKLKEWIELYSYKEFKI